MDLIRCLGDVVRGFRGLAVNEDSAQGHSSGDGPKTGGVVVSNIMQPTHR